MTAMLAVGVDSGKSDTDAPLNAVIAPSVRQVIVYCVSDCFSTSTRLAVPTFGPVSLFKALSASSTACADAPYSMVAVSVPSVRVNVPL